MAEANGSGTPAPPEDDEGPIQRSPEVEAVVEQFFGDDPQPTAEQGGRGW
jgi:hypothetical protein